jgi:LAO/AO transport system kinase
VMVETVGIGQSEIAVADMTDLFVVLVAPGGGDDLQGIKRGVMELADLLIVTKADGDLAAASHRTAADYQSAMHLMRPKYPGLHPQVMTVSAAVGSRIDQAWQAMEDIHATLQRERWLEQLRRDQARRWFWSETQAVLSETILSEPGLAARAKSIEDDVALGRTLPHPAARALIAAFR